MNDKLNLKDREVLLPVNGISMKLSGSATVRDLLRALEGITICLHIGDGDQVMMIPLKQLPTGALPELGSYEKRLKFQR